MTVLFSTSGMFKAVESFAVFVCVVLHRIGNQGSQVRMFFLAAILMCLFYQVWFGTADFEMSYKNTPSEVDAEVLGCGILSCMAIVSLSILASYLIEGREVVQSTVIDSAFCMIAAALLLTSGGNQ